jgi:hypothetical protein
MADQDPTQGVQDGEDQTPQDDFDSDDKAAFPGPDAEGDAPLTSDSPELPDTTDENNRPVDNPSG